MKSGPAGMGASFRAQVSGDQIWVSGLGIRFRVVSGFGGIGVSLAARQPSSGICGQNLVFAPELGKAVFIEFF
jgi:hypothetical protein